MIMAISLEPYIESMEIIVQANQQILDSQINLKNKLLRRNSEKEILLHKEKTSRNDNGKRTDS